MLIRRSLLGSRAGRRVSEGVALATVSSRDMGRLRAIADSRPAEHVHVGAALASLSRLRGRQIWVVRAGGWPVAVAAHFRGLAIAVAPERRGDPDVLSALASGVARLAGPEDVLFGPEEVVAPLLERAATYGLHPLDSRPQVLMVARDLPEHRDAPPGWRLRPARRRDHRWLLRTHAAKCREDLGVDQVSWNLPGYARYFRDLIRSGASFIGERDGQPVFKAETPVESAAARLVEGVFTVPSERGRGCASAAMRELVRRAAADGKRLCLYVQRRNERAQRVYRAAGFISSGPWLTAVVTRRRCGGSPAGTGFPAAAGRGAW